MNKSQQGKINNQFPLKLTSSLILVVVIVLFELNYCWFWLFLVLSICGTNKYTYNYLQFFTFFCVKHGFLYWNRSLGMYFWKSWFPRTHKTLWQFCITIRWTLQTKLYTFLKLNIISWKNLRRVLHFKTPIRSSRPPVRFLRGIFLWWGSLSPNFSSDFVKIWFRYLKICLISSSTSSLEEGS